jgi:FkbM family methyltransferase
MDHENLESGAAESLSQAIWQLETHPGNTWFVDGGAHRGESIMLARKLYGDVIAIAIEPTSACWADLAAQGAIVVPAALWTSFGYVTLYQGEYEVSSTLLAKKKTGGISADRSERVPAVTLGSLLSALPGGRIVLKLDIEGAEYEVLEHIDAALLVRVAPGDLCVDFHGDRIAGFSRKRHEHLVERLLAAGYELPKWIPEEGRVVPWGRKWITEVAW